MADKITEIIDQAAFDQVSKLKADMKVLADTFAETFKQAEAFNNALKSAKGMPEFTENTKKSTAATSELEKITRQLAIARERLSLVENEQKKQLDAVRIAQQEANAASKDAIKLANAEEGSLDALKIKLKQLQAQYSALGEEARKALGPDLLKQVQNTYNSVTQLEKSMGQYSRNVGNYKNETFQLTQVLREVPAFTFSATTGILALSNNLPMLADGFKNVAAATNEATGKVNGTMGALKIFGSSLLSFGSIFSIAIGLFTIFSKEIFEFISGTDKAAEATDNYVSSVADEITKLNQLISLAKNENIARDERLKFAKQLQELYPSYLGNLDKERILAGDIADAYDRLSVALVQKSIFEGLTEQANAIGKKVSPLVVELDKVQQRIDAISGKKGVSINGYQVSGAQSAEGKNKVDELEESAKKLREQIRPLNMEMKRLFELAGNYTNDLTDLGGRNSGGAKGGKSDPAKKSGRSMQALQFARIETNLDTFRGELTPEQHTAIKANLARIKQFAEEQSEINPVEFEWDFQYKLTDFIAKLTPIMKGISDAFGAASNIGNEVAGLIADKANAEADLAIRNINRVEQAEIASLSHLTMSQKKYDEEKKKIEIEADQRRRKAERERITAMRKAAAVQKAADIASIISSTAAAIIGMLKNPGGYPGIGLSIAAGITGGLQLARAVNAPLPQYAKGTDNAAPNFIAGEKGIELVTTPDGKSVLTPDGATLYTNMPSGTKVTSNEKLMQQIYNSAIVKLATGEPVTSSKMEAALIESLDELSTDFKDMKRSVEALKLTVNISGDYSHIAHVKSRVR